MSTFKTVDSSGEQRVWMASPHRQFFTHYRVHVLAVFEYVQTYAGTTIPQELRCTRVA